jgi:predicted acetyltransferase
MEELKFEFPSLEREKEAKEFIQEFKDAKSEINGTGGFDSSENYLSWLEKVNKEHKGTDISLDKVPATTYFVVRKGDNKIVGMVNIRHKTNEFLEKSFGGHIGYSVRPTERKKGYGTEILKMGLKKLNEMGIDSVLLGCYGDNIASKKVILKCGGEQIGKSELEGRSSLGFRINLEKQDLS